MTDYGRGVEQASAVYKEVIREYVVENDKLRNLLQRLLMEYRYIRVRPRKVYLQHEARMSAIKEEMRKLGMEVGE